MISKTLDVILILVIGAGMFHLGWQFSIWMEKIGLTLWEVTK